MIETTIIELSAALSAIAATAASIAWFIAKRVTTNEAISIVKTLKEVTSPMSEGGESITVDEKLRIADEVIEILKK